MMSESSKRHSKFLSLIFILKCLSKEGDWMNYLTCVARGQLDPVFSFIDEHKSEQDFKIKYSMYRYWNALSVGYAKYYSIGMRPITLCTIHL